MLWDEQRGRLRMPKLAIGLPVYNGADLLARSIEKLLSQTFTDFVLILNDNASTDATPDICAEYVARDSRVRYFRNPQTVVWNENFRIVLERAHTPYFMWATHDDIWLPRFAEANLALLDANPDAAASISKVVYFTPEGGRRLTPDTGSLTGTPAQRLKRYFALIGDVARLYGVYRTEALKASFPADLRVFGADWLIVALTLLHGDHLEVDEVLLEREDQPPQHYNRNIGRIDAFQPDWLDYLFPLRRLNRELHRLLPHKLWLDIFPALAYVNLRQSALMLEARLPALERPIRVLRHVCATSFHHRWRTRGARL